MDKRALKCGQTGPVKCGQTGLEVVDEGPFAVWTVVWAHAKSGLNRPP